MFYTLKKVYDAPVERNAQNIKEDRKDYVTWLLRDGVNENLIFIDEMGANMWTRRSYGRNVRGTPVYRVTKGQRGGNQTLCMAISKDGLIHFELLDGPMTTDSFSLFLLGMSQAVNGQRHTIVLDNARPHHGLDLVIPDNFDVRFLPAYSPFLNPIENCFSAVKASIKRLLAARTDDDRLLAAQQNVSVVEARRRKLRMIIIESLDSVTEQTCRNCFNHTFSFIPQCLAMEEVVF